MKCSVICRGLAASVVLALAGCGGGGDDVPTETPPPSLPAGAQLIRLTPNTTTEAYAALQTKVTVNSVVINSPPVVRFTITDLDGNPITGFGATSQAATASFPQYQNLSFSLAKLVPAANGSPSRWVSYIVTTVPTPNAASIPQRPGTDNTGTLVDHGDGNYTYTFFRDVTKVKDEIAAMTVSGANNKADLGDLTYEPNLVHRLTIQISGNVPGTGTNTPNGVQTVAGVPMANPVDVVHDFIPATGQSPTADNTREIVSTTKCNECHSQLGGLPGDSAGASGAGFHGGNRNETRYCMVCHTDQRKYGRTEAAINATTLAFTGSSTERVDGRALGNMPNNIHKIHMGKFLAKTNYNYAGVAYNEVRFPQDVRNCTKCHDASDTSTAKTAQGDNWKNVPNRLACGACHDGIDFATGAGATLADVRVARSVTPPVAPARSGHAGGAQPDDSLCSTCHKPADIDVAHIPVTPTSSAPIASNTNRLPAGAIRISYEIRSVSLNASRQPVMVFRILQNGARVDFNDAATSTELWNGFTGSPRIDFAFSVPQDNVTAPSDFNASVNAVVKTGLWKPATPAATLGTLVGPDAEGFYTATLTTVTIPTTARMLTGVLGLSNTLVQVAGIDAAKFPNGLLVITPNASRTATGFTARRQIVEDARCNRCHQELGAFTDEAFHGGQRNDATLCSVCHTPNRTSAGWSADSTVFIHAVHGGAQRTNPFTWKAASLTESFADIGYPGILDRCEQCHVPGSYDFSNAASAAALPNKLLRTVASGNITAATALADFQKSDLVPVANYGVGFSFNAATASQLTTPAALTTLVSSPMASACYSCHDSLAAKAHMEGNGGSIYALRSVALATVEQCTVCHGPGRIADIRAVHAR